MKRIGKINKRAFTLVEMVLVVAIIVVLAAVLAAGLTEHITRSQRDAANAVNHNDVNDKVQDDIKNLIQD